MALGRRGRALGDEALLDDPRISRAHAELSVDDEDVFWVVDLESRNGTCVNGASIERASLRAGDVVRVGDLLLVASRAPLGLGAASSREGSLLGVSAAAETLRAALTRAAPLKTPVALVGEMGAGRATAAQELHRTSGREGAFVAVRAASLSPEALHAELVGRHEGPRGLIRQADGGTLAVLGLERADPRAQALLCELLERSAVRAEGGDTWQEVDVRLVVTSERAPAEAVKEGALLPELGLRLGALPIAVPPLSSRLEDVAVLLRHFIVRYAGPGATPSPELVLHALRRPWPGHALELETFVESAVLAADGDVVTLPAPPTPAPPSSGAAPSLRFAEDGAWFEVAGDERRQIGHREHLRRIVAFLLAERRERPGRVATVEQLFAAGWPGEQASQKSGANRVYVALTELRRLGLRATLERGDGGYRFDPSAALSVES